MTDLRRVDDADEIIDAYLDDVRIPGPERPWVVVGMVQSLDGATTVDGRSSALGGPPDRAAFRALRAIADVIVVGAGTVRAEGYRAVDLPDPLVAWRVGMGMAPQPRIAIVSLSLDLDLTDSLAASRPIILTGSEAPGERLAELGQIADVMIVGEDGVDVGRGLAALRDMGAGVVTMEGGPSLNGQAMAAGVVDEICVTIAPSVVGGTSRRIVSGPEFVSSVEPERVMVADDHLLLRYLT